MTNHPSVIDLDINELAALLIAQGENGVSAGISLIDESLTSLGPIANVLVQNAMSVDDRLEEYKLPRNYRGDILNNKIIADKVKSLGFQIMSERGLFDSDTEEFTNPIVEPIAQLLTNPTRVIHNFTMLAEYSRNVFVERLAQNMGRENAERAVPLTPPNGISYPVTAYAATIISTEHGGVVIAPNDFNSMLFDLQMIPAGSVSSFIKELVEVATDVTSKDIPRTIVYGVKIPGGTEINASVFASSDGLWSTAFDKPEDDIEYVPLGGDENTLSSGFEIAANRTDLLEASAQRNNFSLPNLGSAADYLARLSDVPLARLVEVLTASTE